MNLSRTLTLRDGRKLKTIIDAISVMLDAAHHRKVNSVWKKTAELLLQAQATESPEDMANATASLAKALQSEGWMV